MTNTQTPWIETYRARAAEVVTDVLPEPTLSSSEGDRVGIRVRTGYRLVQDRPTDCRWGCRCGECDGSVRILAGTVERIVWYADNSTEAVVLLDEGGRHNVTVVSAHGDVC
jgi:hypothetical protein